MRTRAKCSSIAWNPASSSRNPSPPMAMSADSPTVEHSDVRPPTQSQIRKTFSAGIPADVAASTFGGDRDEVAADGIAERRRRPGPSGLGVHLRLERAHRLRHHDEQRLRWIEISRRLARSTGSTFETNRTSTSLVAYGRSAWHVIAGPRSLPPMPMLTTVRMRRPVAPSHSPDRMPSARATARSSSSCTSLTTSRPSTIERARRAAFATPRAARDDPRRR